jgi:hypothetical protein
MTGEPGVFTTPENASADRHPTLTSRLLPHGLLSTSVGVFFPRRCCDRASDTPVATSTLLTPHPPSRMLPFHRPVRLLVEPAGSEDRRCRQDHRRRRLVKADASDDPGCLPPVGTLPRIRWPLQPRSRDLPTAFGDVKTAEQRSLVTLGLVPILARRVSVRPNRGAPFARLARRRFHPPTLVPS